MKNFLISILFLFTTAFAFGQYTYERTDSIPVFLDSIRLEFPFVGGFNAPQFNEVDLNQDGIMDLVISDRSGGRISTFINNGVPNTINYTYAPKYIEAFPEYFRWIISRDYDCDNKMDLFIGATQMRIYKNNSTKSGGLLFSDSGAIFTHYDRYEFNSDIKQALNPGVVNKPAIYDFNNDGDLDILDFNTNGTNIEFHKNIINETKHKCGNDIELRSRCWGDFTESNLSGKLYLDSCRYADISNPESGKKEKIEELNSKGNKHAGSSISAYDFRGNGLTGSTDIIISDVSGRTLTALFNVDSIFPYTNSHIGSIDTAFPSYDVPVDLSIFPASYFVDINNDSEKDMLVTTNSNDYHDINSSRNNILFYKNTGDSIKEFELQPNNNYFYENMLDVGVGCHPTFFDYNKDGLMDLVIGNTGNANEIDNREEAQLFLFENTGNATNPSFTLIDDNFLNLPSIALNTNSNIPTIGVVPTFGDVDGDGDQDLLIGDKYGYIHFFQDTSSNNNPAGFKLIQPNYQNINSDQTAAPMLFDINQDSILDLIIGTGTGKIQYNINLGSKTNPIFTLNTTSILRFNGDTVRFQLQGDPNLNYLTIGSKIKVSNSTNNYNNLQHTIVRINDSANYLDLVSPIHQDTLVDEPSSNASIDYSNKNWGKIDLIKQFYFGDAVPFIYEEKGVQHLIVSMQGLGGTRKPQILFYDSINNSSKNGTFTVLDTNYLESYDGNSIHVSGTDLNNDGQVDLAIGNDAGGLSIHLALWPVEIKEAKLKTSKKHFDIYPNPTNNNFVVELNSVDSNSKIELRNGSGQLVLKRTNTHLKNEFSIENLSPGLYFVSVIDKSGFHTEKLIIKP